MRLEVARHPAFEYLNRLKRSGRAQLRERVTRLWRREVHRIARMYPQLSSSRRRRISLDNLTAKLLKAVHTFRPPLSDTLGALDNLLASTEGQKSYDVATPDENAVAYAKDWIERRYDETLYTPEKWRTPLISSGDGDVLFEWWNGNKGLAVYVSAKGEARYVKHWGHDIDSHMEEGNADSHAARKELWSWLLA